VASRLNVLLLYCVFMSCFILQQAVSAQSYIRHNQVGYHPMDKKVALVIGNDDLSGQSFTVSGGSNFTGQVGNDRGSYAKFSHVYELDFSSITTPGTYTIKVGNKTSQSFKIGEEVYRGIIQPTMTFFNERHCDANCHNDAIAVGGPKNGQKVDVTGSWHDAANPPKFINTFGFSVILMMLANLHNNSELFNAIPLMSQETQRGLNWIYKMWDPTNKVLYAQAGDEQGAAGEAKRVVLACVDGKGANIAGRAAAALALGSIVFKSYNPSNSAKWLTAAKEIYAYGKTVQSTWSCPWDFYPEEYWKDDMALAAAELYRATNENTFLSEGKSFCAGANEADKTLHLYWEDVTPIANYELGLLDQSYKPTAISYFDYKFTKGYLVDMAANKFDGSQGPSEKGSGKPGDFTWGSVEDLACRCIEAMWYQDLSGDAKYRPFAIAQRDFILGRNPWGWCFINSIGSNYVKNIYYETNRPGWWAGGPACKAEVGEDAELGEFDTESAIYQDADNYVFNEATISGNCSGAAMVGWFYKVGATGITATPKIQKPTLKMTLSRSKDATNSTIAFSLSKQANKLQCAVYQPSGKLIWEKAIDQLFAAGNHRISNTIAINGVSPLPQGMYIFKLTALNTLSNDKTIFSSTFVTAR
ncbi:MAG: glycoside hydrolase family 9 protein, partial [Chitinivibrionales bacterium]|nr:glycoside hydrolase family 9 protein [Chitinivibrionales bacterium]